MDKIYGCVQWREEREDVEYVTFSTFSVRNLENFRRPDYKKAEFFNLFLLSMRRSDFYEWSGLEKTTPGIWFSFNLDSESPITAFVESSYSDSENDSPLLSLGAYTRMSSEDRKIISDFVSLKTLISENVERDLEEVLSQKIAALSSNYLEGIVYDVGHGNLNGIVRGSSCSPPTLLYDVGAPTARAAGTWLPYHDLQDLFTEDSVIILSHWDQDHAGGADINPRAFQQVWIAPYQILDCAWHFRYINRLLNEGRLILLPRDWNRFSSGALTLKKGQGPFRSGPAKNHCGIYIRIKTGEDSFALLIADHNYSYIDPADMQDLVGLTASHHGTHIINGALIPAAKNNSGRLAISVGHSRTYGHWTSLALHAEYRNQGWDVQVPTQEAGIQNFPANGHVLLSRAPNAHEICLPRLVGDSWCWCARK